MGKQTSLFLLTKKYPILRIGYFLPLGDFFLDISGNSWHDGCLMKTLILIVRSLFSKPQPPSLLLLSMLDCTHESWLEQLNRQNRLSDYLVK